ncbi:MAG: methylenetetrahydrofolate reductase [Acidiferrobacterales bacterium]|nr:methylenetetrahydrofolate reductase [Acidiferrobacterales bacterium]
MHSNIPALARLLHGYSVETTPGSAAKIPDYRLILSPGTEVYVTTLPGSTIDDTMTVCERLKKEGFVPVPHIVARQIPDAKKLYDGLARFRDNCDGNHVLTIAGGAAKGVGEFDSSMQLLETGLFDKLGIHTIGVAGHPEGSPDISDQQIESALQWKQAFSLRTDASMYIVSQFCFEAKPIIEWEARLTAAGIDLPLHVGIPGVATIGTLLKHAAACGIGNSMLYLRKQARNASKMLTSLKPEPLLNDLAEYQKKNPASKIEKLHIYPLGGLRKSVEWINRIEQEIVDYKNINAA